MPHEALAGSIKSKEAKRVLGFPGFLGFVGFLGSFGFLGPSPSLALLASLASLASSAKARWRCMIAYLMTRKRRISTLRCLVGQGLDPGRIEKALLKRHDS